MPTRVLLRRTILVSEHNQQFDLFRNDHVLHQRCIYRCPHWNTCSFHRSQRRLDAFSSAEDASRLCQSYCTSKNVSILGVGHHFLRRLHTPQLVPVPIKIGAVQGNGLAIRRKHRSHYGAVVTGDRAFLGIVVSEPWVKKQTIDHRTLQASFGQIQPPQCRLWMVQRHATLHDAIQRPDDLLIVLRVGFCLRCRLNAGKEDSTIFVSSQMLEHLFQSLTGSPSIDPHQRRETIILVATGVAIGTTVLCVGRHHSIAILAAVNWTSYVPFRALVQCRV